MDGITFLDASLIYSLLFSPLLTMALLLFWASSNMKKTVTVQLLGIVILFALALLAINSPLILIIGAIAVVLLVVWIFAYKDSFLKGQLSAILYIFPLQIVYYILFPVLINLENALTIALLCVIPILSMVLLYPWTLGNKNTSKGQVFLYIVFIVQGIFLLLNLVFSVIAGSNL